MLIRPAVAGSRRASVRPTPSTESLPRPFHASRSSREILKRRAIDQGLRLYLLWQDPHEGQWFPLLRISPKFFLEWSTTERLTRDESTSTPV